MTAITLDVEDINKSIAAQADKEGVDIGQPKTEKKEAAVTTANGEASSEKRETTSEEITVFRQTLKVHGREIVIEGASPEEVLGKVDIALRAAEPAEEKKEEPKTAKPLLSQDDLFKIGQSLQQGKVEVLNEYLDKSGYVENWLKAQGLNVADLKQSITKSRDSETVTGWQAATDEFKAAHPDYIPSSLNMKLMGYKIAELNLANKPSIETLEKVYASCKADGLLQTEAAKTEETEKAEPAKKKASGSSVFGTGQTGDQRKRGAETTGKLETELEKLKNKLEKNEMTTNEYISAYNTLISDAQAS